ncbi:MAG: hypothetical protein JSU70_10900 [Phycisphaerales bacterium]|nr:MAG: hypothetical protein JSU70_10900 [Phycisphaerales bacterium]
MKSKAKVSLAVLSIGILLIVASCSTMEAYHPPGRRIGHGPPAHAQAHGYHRKHVAGVEVVYDSQRGIYVVVGFPNHYYCDGWFYRHSGTQWEVSLHATGGWRPAGAHPLPPGLQKQVVAKAKPMKNPGRGLGKHKQKY